MGSDVGQGPQILPLWEQHWYPCPPWEWGVTCSWRTPQDRNGEGCLRSFLPPLGCVKSLSRPWIPGADG